MTNPRFLLQLGTSSAAHVAWDLVGLASNESWGIEAFGFLYRPSAGGRIGTRASPATTGRAGYLVELEAPDAEEREAGTALTVLEPVDPYRLAVGAPALRRVLRGLAHRAVAACRLAATSMQLARAC